MLPLHDVVDFANNPRFLILGLRMNLSCPKQDDKFFIVSAADNTVQFKIQDLQLHLDFIQAIPSKMQKITDVLFSNNKAAIYPQLTRVVRNYTIPTGRRKFTQERLFENNVPNILLYGLMKATAFNGAHNENPFEFITSGLSSVRLLHGQREISEPRIYADSQGDYAELVWQLMRATEQGSTSNNRIINRDNFRSGFAISGFNLNPSGRFRPWEETSGINTGAAGLSLELEFSADTSQDLKLIVVGVFENNVFIDGGRNVTIENQF